MSKKIFPPRYFSVLLILLIITHFLTRGFWFLKSPLRFLGVIFILFGGIMNIWTDQLFKKWNTTVKPDELPSTFIQTGPFKISRHPMYLGMAAILLGSSIVCGTVITIIYPIVFIILMEILFISKEENNMKKQFGNTYLQYNKRVRRWI